MLALIIAAQWSRAQAPAAEFSGSSTNGCAPMTVNFSDLSTGNPTQWNWDFGNGQLSTLKNPSVTYTQPGRYTVRLVARNANGVNDMEKTEYIVVNSAPAANFSVSATSGCAPSAFRFTDLSTIAEGTITDWLWDFGDGRSSTEQHPEHVYTNAGAYNVRLTVTSNNGCQSTVTRNSLVQVAAAIVPSFSYAPPASCNTPFTVQFTNQSTGAGAISYRWDFGNGSSTQANPAPHIYNASGDYTVKLVATSSFGCVDSAEQTISLNGFTTDFTISSGVCRDAPVVFQNSSGQTPVSSVWDFGNGDTMRRLNASYTYTAPGAYTVKLVNRYAGCADSISRSVVINNPPAIDFNADRTVSCQAPFTATFRDLTPGGATRVWDFGDGTPPQTTTNATIAHTYNTTGNFRVLLRVIDGNGCESALQRTDYIRVAAPSVSLSNTSTSGCIPFSYTPAANINSLEGISSYTWDFGEGAPIVTTSATPPSHNYSATGVYPVSLTIATTGGCTASGSTTVRTGTPPSGVNFTAPPPSCASSSILFTANATGANRWEWDFGDGSPAVAAQTTEHHFEAPGQYTVTLTAYNNGCPGAASAQLVEILPPVARFRSTVSCTTDEVAFINESITDPAAGAVGYRWNFGDPSLPEQTTADPTVSFPAQQQYTVTLIVDNGACSDTAVNDVILTRERAGFTADKESICRGEQAVLTAAGNPANITAYQWRIGTGGLFTGGRTLARPFTANGDFDIYLRITDINGCMSDTLAPAMISVSGPTAGFSAAAPVSCGSEPVTFTDQSVPSNQIVEWRWNFGDGSPQQVFSGGPFTHSYAAAGAYQVSLSVEDINGCAHTINVPNAISVSQPSAYFRKDTALYCPDIPIQFRDSSSGNALLYNWDFGDGGSSDQSSPVHAFSGADNDYLVKLTVTDNLGCSDSITAPINIRSPKPAFDLADTATICLPFIADFTFRGQDYESYYWDPGDGSGTTNIRDLQHAYTSYGVFNPKLYLVGYGGCLDSVASTVVIADPGSAAFDYNAPPTCNELTVDFNILPAPYSGFTLYFGDGDSAIDGRTTYRHFYDGPGTYTPMLKLTDITGCEVSLTGHAPVRVIGAEPVFGMDQKDFCDSGSVSFTNYTLGNDPVTSYHWNFGDGLSSADMQPAHDFTSPGLYPITLAVQTQSGCADLFRDTVLIYRSPVISAINSRDTVCINSPVDFSGNLAVPDTNAVEYRWSFGDGESSAIQTPVKTFRSTGSFVVHLDTRIPYGCSSSISRPVHVVPLPVVNPMSEQVIPVGSSVALPATYAGDVIQYSWTPDKNLSCNDCPVPIASPRENTAYKVTATDAYGCAGTGEVTVMVICNDKNFFIPNTFSPNNDGANDYFFPRGSGIRGIQSLRIFNRWGEIVFERKNFPANSAASGWDGTFKGKPAISDVYIYTIEVICENAQVIPFQGNIMLLR